VAQGAPRFATMDNRQGDASPVKPQMRRTHKMAVSQPFPKGTFKVEPGPGKNEVSVLFRPTQSTIVFSITRPGQLASEYRVHHTRAGRFGETEVAEAARELALASAKRSLPT
jgi:hypothetical protein